MRYDFLSLKSRSGEWTAMLCRDTDRDWRIWATRGNDGCIGWTAGITHWWTLHLGYWTITIERFTSASEPAETGVFAGS